MLKKVMLPEGQKGIYRDYLENRPPAVHFLGEHYSGAGVIRQRAERVCETYPGDRARLADILLDYNRQTGCSAATEANIAKLRDNSAVAVLCGQQAGLFSGPLYTVFKAAAAVKRAARLEKELERPVVPVFWIAAEDHDFSEANHCWVLDRENRPQKVQLELEHSGEPVGRLKLTAEAGRLALEALLARLPETEFIPALSGWLEETRAGSETPAEWFARIMARLFADNGLVLFDPLYPAIRPLMSPVFVRTVERRAELRAALAEREELLKAEGYPLQVEREEHASLLMMMGERRTALYIKDNRYKTRDGSLSLCVEEMAKLAADAPQQVSPNVLLRPLVQDWLFPTVAFITGPGETAYMAQVTALYPVFGLTPPVLWPRPGLTLIEPRLARHLQRYAVPEAGLPQNLEAELERVLRRKEVSDIDGVFEHLRRHLAVEYDHVRRELVRLNPQLGELAEKNLQHVYSEIRYLEEKAREEFRKKNEAVIRHFGALSETLQPFGMPQERVYCILTFWAKYGPRFWRQLVLDFPQEPGHYLYYYQAKGDSQ